MKRRTYFLLLTLIIAAPGLMKGVLMMLGHNVDPVFGCGDTRVFKNAVDKWVSKNNAYLEEGFIYPPGALLFLSVMALFPAGNLFCIGFNILKIIILLLTVYFIKERNNLDLKEALLLFLLLFLWFPVKRDFSLGNINTLLMFAATLAWAFPYSSLVAFVGAATTVIKFWGVSILLYFIGNKKLKELVLSLALILVFIAGTANQIPMFVDRITSYYGRIEKLPESYHEIRDVSRSTNISPFHIIAEVSYNFGLVIPNWVLLILKVLLLLWYIKMINYVPNDSVKFELYLLTPFLLSDSFRPWHVFLWCFPLVFRIYSSNEHAILKIISQVFLSFQSVFYFIALKTSKFFSDLLFLVPPAEITFLLFFYLVIKEIVLGAREVGQK